MNREHHMYVTTTNCTVQSLMNSTTSTLNSIEPYSYVYKVQLSFWFHSGSPLSAKCRTVGYGWPAAPNFLLSLIRIYPRKHGATRKWRTIISEHDNKEYIRSTTVSVTTNWGEISIFKLQLQLQITYNMIEYRTNYWQ